MLGRMVGICMAVAMAGGWPADPARAAGMDLFAPAAPASAGVPHGLPAAAHDVVLAEGAAQALAGPAARSIRIELARGLVVVAERRDGVAIAGGAVWSGDVLGDGAGSADLVVRGGGVTGQVTVDGRTFRIEPDGRSGRHRIVPADRNRHARDIVLTPPRSALAAEPTGDTRLATTAATTATTVRVLIGYTPGAQRSVEDMVTESHLAVSLANGAFRRSGVLVRLELAGLRLVRFDETGRDFYTILRAATAGTGAFSGLASARNATRADLVSVLTGLRQYCGMAWIGPAKAYAVSVVSTSCIAYHSFAHEVGHNFGLRHDRYVEGTAPASRYHFGFVNRTARIRDIMSYANACATLGFSCPRVPMFSTPRRDYNGKRIGIPEGTVGAADAARTLNARRGTVAGFR